MRWNRIGRISLLIVLTVVAALYIEHAVTYITTRAQADREQALVRRLTEANAALAQQAKSLSDPATIERDAHALGMVRAGERPYVITGLPDR